MAIRLFCRATPHSALRILAEGFLASPQGGVWLSKDFEAVASDGGSILSVLLDLEDDDLEAYAMDVSTEETWDDETWDESAGHWVKRPGATAERVRWYEVPASIVNGRGSVEPLAQHFFSLEPCTPASI